MSLPTYLARLFGIYAALIGVVMLVRRKAMLGVIVTADERAAAAIVLGLWLDYAAYSG
jgi:hypothetical protein